MESELSSKVHNNFLAKMNIPSARVLRVMDAAGERKKQLDLAVLRTTHWEYWLPWSISNAKSSAVMSYAIPLQSIFPIFNKI